MLCGKMLVLLIQSRPGVLHRLFLLPMVVQCLLRCIASCKRSLGFIVVGLVMGVVVLLFLRKWCFVHLAVKC
jgi:hypothetical protein